MKLRFQTDKNQRNEDIEALADARRALKKQKLIPSNLFQKLTLLLKGLFLSYGPTKETKFDST